MGSAVTTRPRRRRTPKKKGRPRTRPRLRPHGAHGPGHGSHIHDAPPSMAIPLIVLAIGSVVAGYVGVPHAIGGANRIERYLEPSFEAAPLPRQPSTADASPTTSGVQMVAAQEPRAETAAQEEHQAESASTELMLMGVSSGVALAGIGIAVFFWLRNPSAADRLAQRFRSVYNLLLHKYDVDEIYDAAIVQPIKVLSTGGLWKASMPA